MKRCYSPYLLIFALSFLCSNCDEMDDGCDPEMTEYRLFENQDIVIDSTTEVDWIDIQFIEGDKLLFAYERVSMQCDDVVDDESGEGLYFVIGPDIANFEYNDEELLEILCFYRPYSATLVFIPDLVTEGYVRGERSGDEYFVEVSVKGNPFFTSDEPKLIEFSGWFALE